MYTSQPKKALLFYVLEILEDYTDAEHRLSQQRIIEVLQQIYDVSVDRKTLRRALDTLKELGYDIESTGAVRAGKDGQPARVSTDWYLIHKFADSELRLLIDSLVFSKQLPNKHKGDLIAKLCSLSSKYFRSNNKHILSLPDVKATNQQLFYNIEMLDKAISHKRKVNFQIGAYDTSGVMSPKTDKNGDVRNYSVDPYQMVASAGRYYLLGRHSEHDTLANFRINRIMHIVVTDEPARPLKDLAGYENGLNLPKHMAEHIFMYSGNSIKVRLRIAIDFIVNLYDWFDSVRFENTADVKTEVVITVNEHAIFFWCMQFSQHIEVLEPPSLRERLQAEGKRIAQLYAQADV